MQIQIRLNFVFALTLAVLMLGACGNEKQKDSLGGYIGPGAGGQAVAPGTTTSQTIATPNGTTIGTFSYDTGFFAFSSTDPTQIGLLIATSSGAPLLSISISHISGRADTPCRFDAALLARDAGLEIGDTGFRKNAQGQELYQVNLSGSGQYGQLFCANLKNNTGAQFSILADAPNKVTWMQVYAVLNSIRVQ